MKLVDIGFGNLINRDRLVAIVSPDSLPVRRLVQDAKNAGCAVDVSCGTKTRSVILTDSDQIFLSGEEIPVLEERFND